MENKSGAFRKKKVYFSQVSNSALRDEKLSLKAKGLYALIQSYITLEDFTLYKSTLKQQCLDKEKSFENTWKELKEAGYLIQYRLQGDKGFFYYEYELLDEANKDLANEVHATQNRKSESEKNHIPKKVGMDENQEIHNPKQDMVDEGCDGVGGIYNNTDSNNTDLNNTIYNTSSSKKDNSELVDKFEANICPLKEITKTKFIEYSNKCDADLINAIIEYVAKKNKQSFDYFEIVIETAINNNINTSEGFINSVEVYKASKKKTSAKKNYNKTDSNKGNTKELKFNNFPAREYDYDSLEKKLLGWE